MEKEELKKIVLEILNTENEESFLKFLKSIAENLKDNKTLKLDGIGNFQLKKEPLSRMERRGEESETQILIFLPEGENSEEKLLSLEIENSAESIDEFNDSVFDIGVNKPTIISDPEEDDDEVNENKILEFIESGSIIENFDILSNQSPSSLSNEINSDNDESDFYTDEVTDNEVADSSLDGNVTEVHINKNFLNDSSDEEILENELEND
nr:hypothetical protein [Melioribacteraceae bacterium]